MDYAKESLKMHYDLKGKLEIKCRAAVKLQGCIKSCLYTRGSTALSGDPEGY